MKPRNLKRGGGYTSSIAYSRSKTGELLKDGNGQVNFEVLVDSEYFIKEIIILPDNTFKNFKLPTDPDINRDNTYRITKITGDTVVKIVTEKISPFVGFVSYTDNVSQKAIFNWSTNLSVDEYKVLIKDYSNNSETRIVLDANELSFEYPLNTDSRYDFEFTAFKNGNLLSETAKSTKYFAKTVLDSSFPRLEITTKNYELPSCDYVTHPADCWGEGITNNSYVSAVAKLYNNGNIIYDSTTALNEADYYTGAKIKIRGNTSAYSEKKPYKLKLSSKVDLLSGLVPNRDDGKNYKHKEWLLLSSTALNLKQVAGWSLSEVLNMGYTPAYSYVALIINGDFNGLYILCESVAQGSGTGDTQTRCKVGNDGFIVESDAYWWNEDLYFETPWNVTNPHYTFKYPDSDDIKQDSPQYIYIKNYITEFENALLAGDVAYKNYIDEESFAKWLVAQDILASYDGGGTNIYLTKKDSTTDSQLKMEILWDFDSAFSNVESFSRIRTAEFYYYTELLHQDDFVNLYKNIYAGIRDTLIEEIADDLNAVISDEFNLIFNTDRDRWQSAIGSATEQKDEILNYLTAHLNWMDAQILQ